MVGKDRTESSRRETGLNRRVAERAFLSELRRYAFRVVVKSNRVTRSRRQRAFGALPLRTAGKASLMPANHVSREDLLTPTALTTFLIISIGYRLLPVI